MLFINRLLSRLPFNSSFNSLESVSFNEIRSQTVIPILQSLSSIPRLFSLSMTTIGIVQDPNTIHQLLFDLPVLKYCNTMFKWLDDNFSLSNFMKKTTTIEYFISKSEYNLYKLSILLSFMPRLVHLSCCAYGPLISPQIQNPITLNNLIYFRFDHNSIPFDQFEIFMSNFFHQIQVLRISLMSNNNDYLDSNRWEQLITRHLPRLYTFDLQHLGEISNVDECHSLINGFNSPFWIEHKWFFAHQHFSYDNSVSIFFYSIYRNNDNSTESLLVKLNNSNRYKHLTTKTCPFESAVDLVRIRYILIENNKTAKIDLHSSQLTLSCTNNNNNNNLITDELKCILPLEQITYLTATNIDDCLDQLIQLIRLLPNIQRLTFSIQSYCSLVLKTGNDILPIDNNIQQIIINGKLTFKEVQLFINIFPHVRHLEMYIKENDLEFIIRFLLKHNIKKNHCLHLLSLRDAHSAMINRLQKVIDREELVKNYSIEHISDTMYLCW